MANSSDLAKQGRYWMIVIPYDKWTPPTTLNPLWNCIEGQQEIGEGGYRHWQLNLALKTKARGGAVKKMFCEEACLIYTTSAKTRDYVWKEETSVEGTRFRLGEFAIRRNDADDWEKIRTQAQQGDLKSIPADIYVKCYNSLRNIAMDNSEMPANLSGCCGVWIWGPPGVGKSHMARNKYGCNYDKMPNKWWDGYQTGQIPLLDDFGHSHTKLTDYLKRWADMYPFKSEIKGSSKYLRPELMVVTSNYSIDQLFPDKYEQSILLDRFKVIHIPFKMHNLAKRPHVLDDQPLDIPRSPAVKKSLTWTELGFEPTPPKPEEPSTPNWLQKGKWPYDQFITGDDFE